MFAKRNGEKKAGQNNNRARNSQWGKTEDENTVTGFEKTGKRALWERANSQGESWKGGGVSLHCRISSQQQEEKEKGGSAGGKKKIGPPPWKAEKSLKGRAKVSKDTGNKGKKFPWRVRGRIKEGGKSCRILRKEKGRGVAHSPAVRREIIFCRGRKAGQGGSGWNERNQTRKNQLRAVRGGKIEGGGGGEKVAAQGRPRRQKGKEGEKG